MSWKKGRTKKKTKSRVGKKARQIYRQGEGLEERTDKDLDEGKGWIFQGRRRKEKKHAKDASH